jgi:hypothetical protein
MQDHNTGREDHGDENNEGRLGFVEPHCRSARIRRTYRSFDLTER